MAMHWTREHVQKFGGDKNKVTIGGMSAGGQSIQGFFSRLLLFSSGNTIKSFENRDKAHSVMGSSEPLFDQMISISGPGGVPYKNSSEAQTFYESIAGNLGCCGRANIGNENFGKCQPGLRPDQPAIPEDFVQCLLGKTTQEIQVFFSEIFTEILRELFFTKIIA